MRQVLIILGVFLLFLPGFFAQSPQRQGSVYVLAINGEISPGLVAYVKRGVTQAEQNKAAALLIEIGTFGGRVDAAVEIRDLLLRTPLTVITLVKNEAWSAGALLTLAGRYIAMAPGSSIGAAEPIPKTEKNVAALRSLFAATAERYDRDPRVAAAMVDSDIAIAGWVDKGKLLSLTAQEAKELGLADLVARERQVVLQHFGFEGRQIIEINPSLAEAVARFLTNSWVSQILLAFGLIGLIVELSTPGLGLAGIGGTIALALFFGGRLFAGIAGWEVVILFLFGLLLLGLELFVLPGFGVVGLGGLAALFASLYLSFGNLPETMLSLAVSFLVACAAILVLWRWGRRFGFWERFILRNEEKTEAGYITPRLNPQQMVEQEGIALTYLRPAGIVGIMGRRYDAITEGGFIPQGTKVRVINTIGSTLVVQAIEKNEKEGINK